MRGCVSPEPERDDEGRRELDLRVGFGLFASDTQLDSLLSIALLAGACGCH